MDFDQLVKQRQSVRRFDPRPVEKEKIKVCLEAARLAPSASNSQPWYFVVVDDPELKNKVARATFDDIIIYNRFTLQAPVIIVMVTEKAGIITRMAARLKKREFSLIDNGIAAAHFCLKAAEIGLGTCMMGWFNQNKVKKLLNIPDDKFLSLVITLGYPAEGYKNREKTRKSLSEITGWNKYH